jgi:hypothetical protein
MPLPPFIRILNNTQTQATEEEIKNTLRYLLSYDDDEYLKYFKSITDPEIKVYVSDFIIPAYKKYNQDSSSIKETPLLIKATEVFLSVLNNIINAIVSNFPKNPEAIKLVDTLKKLQAKTVTIQTERSTSLSKPKTKSTDATFKELGRQFISRQKGKEINLQKLIMLRSKYISAETKFKRNYKIFLLKNTNLTPEQMDKEVNESWDQLLSSADLIADNTKADRDKIVNDLVKAITEEQLTFDAAETKVKRDYDYKEKKIEDNTTTYDDIVKNWSDKEVVAELVKDVPNDSDRNLMANLLFQIGKLCDKFDLENLGNVAGMAGVGVSGAEERQAATAKAISECLFILAPLVYKYKWIEDVEYINSDIVLIRENTSSMSAQTRSEQGLGEVGETGGVEGQSIFKDPNVKKNEDPIDERARKQKKRLANKKYISNETGREATQKAQERHFAIPEVHEPRRERARVYHAEYAVWEGVHKAFKDWLERRTNKFAEFYKSSNAKQDTANETREILNKLNQIVDKIQQLDIFTKDQKLEKIKLLQKNLQENINRCKNNLENNPIQTLGKLLVLQAFDSLATNGISLLEKRKTESYQSNLIANSSDRFKILSSL